MPERIVRAMSQPVIDHRGPTFGALVHDCLAGLKDVFQTTRGQIVLYPGSGTGAWEAALVNTLSPGDRVLACVNGHFSTGFANTAAAYGMDVERLDVAYGEGVPAERVAARLAADGAHELRAILVVHNETSTGVTSNVAAVRAALDDARHPALLLVDTVSSLASIDFRFDAWGVDVALTGPQKGLMLPPGMAILAASERALTAAEQAKCPRAFWDWRPVLERNRRASFHTRRPPCCCSGCGRRWRCCATRGCPTCSRGTPAWPRRAGAPSARSASASSASGPRSIPTR